MRRILYVTGTRADFGLMGSTLAQIHASPALELGVLVTGMHLDKHYGYTVTEVEASGLPIVNRVPVELGTDDRAAMPGAIAHEIVGVVDTIRLFRPDLLLLLGDRGEMLAGAIAALHLNVPVAHLHGGELSGTVDEPVRHAISKLSHLHFTATESSRDRLIRMGELAENIYVTGAPGLDGLTAVAMPERRELLQTHDFDASRPVALVLYHPVVQQAEEASLQMAILLEGLGRVEDLQLLVLMPNADTGGEGIRSVIGQWDARVRAVTHLPRADFVRWMAVADVMVGNSSSGIIEAASFGTPVVNVGDRQRGRERNSNVVDVAVDVDEIEAAVNDALRAGRYDRTNVYGNGCAGDKIVGLLESIVLSPKLLAKSNAY